MKPLPPLKPVARAAESAFDRSKDGYSLDALQSLLRDCEDQPNWRDMADLCCLYYDVGGIYAPKQEYEFRKNGLEPRKINLVARVINGVLGQEAKSRRDPKLEPDDDEGADVADVVNVKLKEAQRETMADMAISNGYAGQVKSGIGWVEVSRSSDPREYPYRVQELHRNEIYWDWRAKRIDLRDARWLCRPKWEDLDEVVARFPEFEEVLRQAVGNWASFLADEMGMMEERIHAYSSSMGAAFAADRAFRIARSEWVDSGRERIRMYEVWYRVPAHVAVMKVGQRWIPVDLGNPLHYEAISRGAVKVEKRVTSQVRRAIFAGPFRLVDEGTTRTRFPYIPFFAFRADEDYTPYGLIHGMIAPQDEFNERRMRIQWMLKAQQLIIDNDALDGEYNTIEDITATMMRPDMVAVLDPDRKNQDAIKFRNDFELQREQFELMQDSKQLIQDVPGVYATQLGNAPTGVTSGLAINSLVEQGLVAMGELNDNYSHSRRLVYEALVDLILEDLVEPNMQVRIGSGQSRRTVVLNTADKDGRPLNVVKAAKVNTGLGELPATPAYQMQMSQMLGEMIGRLANTPQAALMLPAYVEVTSAFGPGRKQLADDMRRMGGMPMAGDRASAEQWQAQQTEQAKRNAQAQAAMQDAQVQGAHAKTALEAARARLADAQAAETLLRADGLANEPDEDALIRQSIQEAMQPPQQPAEAMPAA